ncbi:UDP-glycosyltransferase 92A1-like protein [Tanacetum coccineum]
MTITIVNSPLNINYLRSAVAKHAFPTSHLHLKSLLFNSSDHGLPPNSENTDGLALTQIIKLFTASLALEPVFRGFLSDIIAGGGSLPITGLHSLQAAYASIWLNLPHKNLVTGETYDQFHVPGFPKTCRFEISQLHQFLQAADGKDEWSRFFQTQLSLSLESNGWLCNTDWRIETNGIGSNVGSDTGSGLIGQRSGKEPGIRPENCIEWLDAHSQGSVLYISFGSQNTISETHIMELAKGLEESKKPFIWVIRPPIGFDLKGDFRPEWLPLGFEDRIGKQGLMVHNWAPQLEILCHRSTGAFLTHCGWNSVMESLSQGVPLIGWPLAAEQGYNAKMLVEEMGVCVVLTRGVRSRLEKRRNEERIGKQGLMVHNWAPQLEILCHMSTGAFLTHCGWNSVMESLSQGVPLIGWPLAAEQGYNAKMLVEEMGVCVVLARGVHSRIEKEGVRRVIEAVLDKSEYRKGESMRK